MDRDPQRYRTIYFAGGVRDSFSDEESYGYFCDWVGFQLTRNFPDHKNAVVKEFALTRIVNIPGDDEVNICLTDDDENRERITAYCNGLVSRWHELNPADQ